MQDVFLLMVTPPTTLHLLHALGLIKSNRDSVRKAREAYLQHPYHDSQLKVVNLVSRPLPRWTKSQKTQGTRLNRCKIGVSADLYHMTISQAQVFYPSKAIDSKVDHVLTFLFLREAFIFISSWWSDAMFALERVSASPATMTSKSKKTLKQTEKSPASFTTLPQECGSLHTLSKKYLLPLEKQSTTPIVHYTFHYIELIPVSAAVYREV